MSNSKGLTGEIINGFLVKGVHHIEGKRTYWSVVCTCGKIRQPMRADSLKKHSGKCTCLPEKGDILNGYMFTGDNYVKGNKKYWEVTCTGCGESSFKRIDTLRKIQKDYCSSCTNTYVIEGDVVIMDISTQNYPNTFTRFDLKHLKDVLKHRWYAVKGGRTTYVQCTCKITKKKINLHRYILKESVEGFVVDHQSGDGLDNTLDNIIITTQQGNSRNTPLSCKNTSGYMGVSENKNGTWRAYITIEYKQINLGTYTDFEEAVMVRKEAEVLYGFHENHGRLFNKGETHDTY